MKKIITCSKTVKRPLKAYESINVTLTLKSEIHSNEELQDAVNKIVEGVVSGSNNTQGLIRLDGISEYKANIWLICSRGMNDNVTLSLTEEYEDIDQGACVLKSIFTSFQTIKMHLRKEYAAVKRGAGNGK